MLTGNQAVVQYTIRTNQRWHFFEGGLNLHVSSLTAGSFKKAGETILDTPQQDC